MPAAHPPVNGFEPDSEPGPTPDPTEPRAHAIVGDASPLLPSLLGISDRPPDVPAHTWTGVVAAGLSFDAVSVPMGVGLNALDLLLRDHGMIGPVVADGRCQVQRVGFLLDPGTLAHTPGFAWWCRGHGMRIVSHGSVLVLPPAASSPAARLQWLVPPGAGRTEPAALLGCLRRALGQTGHRGSCQLSVR